MTPETENAALPAEPVTQRKRGRPRKSAAAGNGAAISSLTKTATRRTRKPKTGRLKTATAQPAPAKSASSLNRLINGLIVAAVFITALAIQRIVPTAPVTSPKVETITQAAPAPAASPEPAAAPPAAAPSTAPAAVAPAPEAAPAPVAASPAKPKKVARKTTTKNRGQDYSTPLNSGGVEDLDNESARLHYLKTTKIVSRTATPK